MNNKIALSDFPVAARSRNTSTSPTVSTTHNGSASSKVYNIQVSQGDISPIQTSNITSSTTQLATTAINQSNRRSSKKSQQQTSATSPYVLSVASTSPMTSPQHQQQQQQQQIPSSATIENHKVHTITNTDVAKQPVDPALYLRESILNPRANIKATVTVSKSDANNTNATGAADTSGTGTAVSYSDHQKSSVKHENKYTNDVRTLKGTNLTITKSDTKSKHTISHTNNILDKTNISSASSSTLEKSTSPPTLKNLQVDLSAISASQFSSTSTDAPSVTSLENTNFQTAAVTSETGSIISKDSFLSSTTGGGISAPMVSSGDGRTIVPRSSAGSFGGSTYSVLNISDEFGKQLVDDVRKRYIKFT